MDRYSIALLLLVSTLPAGAARADVFVIDDDGGPGVDFTQIGQAVLAAADDDVLLVRDGTYSGFSVDGKSLAITADDGATVVVSTWIEVRDLAADQFVSLAGLQVSSPSNLYSAALRVTDCAGAVWVERCTIVSYNGLGQDGAPGEGLLVTGSAHVTVASCTVTGGGPGDHAVFGMPAIASYDSFLTVHDSTAHGGPGVCDSFYDPTCLGSERSGAGLFMSGGTAFVGGSTLVGGASGYYCDPPNPWGTFCWYSAGGDGILLGPGDPQVWVFDSVTEGVYGMPPGEGVDVSSGVATPLPGMARTLEVASPVREGQPVAVHVAGSPGDQALLFVAWAPGAWLLPKYSGVLLVDTSLPLLLDLGLLSASGTLDVLLVAPLDLGPGLEGQTLTVQCALVPTVGAPVLSGPARAVLLDAAF